MAYLSMPSPELYREAVRSGLAWWYTVDASYSGTPVVGATGMLPTGGTITDTSRPGVRRVLNGLTVVPEPGQTPEQLYGLLGQFGTLLTVTAHVRLTGREIVDIPMGVFDVDRANLSASVGSVSLTAPDKWIRIKRASFVVPMPSTPGLLVREQIAVLIRGALGAGEPVIITATSEATVGAMVWEKDREKAINELAEGIGAWVFFDRDGVATVADIPTGSDSDDYWLVDAGENGVLTDLDREKTREGAFNVVVVESSASDEAKFATQVVFDNDPASATYAGSDPSSDANVPGPFGVVTTYLDTPIDATETEAWAAGYALLRRSIGAASQVSMGSVPNPAVDAFDALDVIPPHGTRRLVVGYTGGEGFGTMPFGEGPFGEGTEGVPTYRRVSVGAVIERHLADTVTHPLTMGPEQTIDGRSTGVAS